ncbi:MAG: preprotein translocase subunit SecG [Pirellulales bacterium]
MTDFILMADWMQWIIGPAMFFTSFFLILLVLVQRGRGGGLAGALGGAGGQSAFGTKAGDVFTKITIGFAAIWILLCVLALALLQDQNADESKLNLDSGFNPPVINVNEDTENSTSTIENSLSVPPVETEEAPAEDANSDTSSEAEATTEPAVTETETSPEETE